MRVVNVLVMLLIPPQPAKQHNAKEIKARATHSHQRGG